MDPKLTAEQARAMVRVLLGRGEYRIPTAAKMKPKRKAKKK